MTSPVPIRSIALTCIALSLASCGSAAREIDIPNKLPTFPVTGELWIDGEPAEFVMVKLVPLTPLDTRGCESAAMTDANGKFEISTYSQDDGAPAAEYALTFTRRRIVHGRPGKDDLGERYATIEKSPQKVVVEESPNDIGVIELTTK